MKFEEFITLNIGDNVFWDSKPGKVMSVRDTYSQEHTVRNGVICPLYRRHRELEIQVEYKDQTKSVYPYVYTDVPNEHHNVQILNRISKCI